MDSSTGLRAVNEIEQIAQFEFGAVMASEALKALFRSVKPGMSEFAAVQSMGLGVLPHSCHTMLSTGTRLSGLESPSGKIIERGDPLTSAVGYWGGLSSRVAWMVADKSELPSAAGDWLEKLAMPYFACAARVVRNHRHWRQRRHARCDRPQAPWCAVLQPDPQPRPSDPPRRVDEYAGLSEVGGDRCAPARRSSATSSRPSARRITRLISRTASRCSTAAVATSCATSTRTWRAASTPAALSWPTRWGSG